MNDKTDPPDLKVYKATKREQEVQDMIKGLESLQANKEQILEYQKLAAEFKYAKYKALREAGFTPDRAIQLLKGDDSFI